MHHGSGSQNMQRPLQRPKSQQATVNHPQSPVTPFSSAASPSAPQSPNYQIIMSRSPAAGPNMNITLQNVGQMVTANQQITLTTLPIQNPASPGFQHTTPQWRFEHTPPSYIQVTSPVPQPIQPQSPTQHSPVSLQGVTRPAAPAAALGVHGQSPTRFVDAGMLVRQISLGSPSGSGHFVYQEGTGLAQIAPATPGQVQLASPGAPGSVRERRLSQPHSQTGGTIHHHAPQSPVATTLSTLGSPGHITTSNLPPQIRSAIQEQLRSPLIFEKTQQGVVSGVGTTATSFSIPSSIPPSSPSLTSPSQGIPSNSLAPTSMTVGTVKKQAAKKLEEIAPSTPEIAQLRKQCLEHHTKKMENLKEVFKEYLIELFFLQHLQGNMMDYLAFKKKPCVPLYTYLRQSDLDLEDEEEEEEQSEVINDEVLHQLALGVRSNMYFLSSVQIAGQKQNQQQYDPSKGPPVQNAASLHTPPPQLPGRLPQGAPPMTGLPMALSQQAQLVENPTQPGGQLQAQVKVQTGAAVLTTVNPHTQLQAQLQHQMQSGLHLQLQPQQQQSQAILQSGQSNGPNDCQESQVHQRISELRKEGQWSASRLPKLVEASRPKSHWDYLLEEMQWMAADFAQERRWKEAAAKKLVRTCARYHQEQKKSEERSKKEREIHLRHIASTIAREVEFFWSNIEQVVEIKLQFEIYEKRLKALGLQKAKGETDHKAELVDLAKDGTYFNLSLPPEAVLIDSLLSVDQYRGADKAASSDSDGKPCKDIAEVAAATELILPKGSFRTTSSTRSPAPFLLHGFLREYQQIGVDWLVNLYKKHLNGILADETGLGKTVQTVAYMAHLAGQEGIWGPHLVVVRTCKLLSWEVEFKRWCPGLKILLYLGNRRERRSKRRWWGEANSFHVCVTSYKLLMKDQSHFLKRRWRHLVLDEVQLIKNMTEKHWETVFALRSEQRILLINTPLQNTLKELWTMIHFLLPGITRPYSDFPVKAGTDQNQDYCHKLVIRLHRMIQPFILRRSKRDVEKQLPKKYEHILKCRLSNRQKSLYEDILTQPGAQEALKTGHFVSVLQVLMQLQRVCNHPELVVPRVTSSSYFFSSLEYNVPSLVLGAIQTDSSKIANLSIFDLINNENRLTRYQTEEAVPKLKIEHFILCEDLKKLFQPVQYGTKPEGRLAAFANAAGQRPPTSSPATGTSPSTTSQAGQTRGKSPVTTSSTHVLGAAPVALGQSLAGTVVGSVAPNSQPGLTQVPRSTLAPSHAIQPSLVSQRLVLTSQAQARLPSGDVVKIAQLANIAGSQNRISQPETPVTLQFQGNKFTLSPSQLRQLTTGQPLQLQGNILQIVSAPGQQIIRPQASMVMQTMPQAVPASSSSHITRIAVLIVCTICHCDTQESSEEKTQLMKARLSRLFEANEQRCSRRVLYGSDLLQACTLGSEPGHSALTAGGWSWVGRESCIRAQRTCVATTSALKSSLLSVEDRLEAASSLVKRLVCVVPPAVASAPHLYAANPPVPYRLEQKSHRRQLQEASVPHSADIHLASRHLFCCPDLQLMQMDSGKLEALAILLQKLKSESRRVLIFTQMLKMLDILEAFLDYRQLTYVRIDESFSCDERQENMKKFNRNRQVFCSILTNRCCSAVGTVFDADTIIFYDTDLNPSMDARTQEWCDKIGRSKDIHIYRLESGNSIEEKLLKNGTKDLIREVAAQGTDYTLAFLTQRTIQDLFEVEAGSGEKVEEFVVLHQEPSASEAISPRVARPYIQALQSINLDALTEDEEQQKQEDKLPDQESTERDQESEIHAKEEPAQIEELNAVMEQLTPIERYALHYLEYLHVSDDEKALREKLECSKRSWELQQLQRLKEEEQQQHMMEGDEDLFTYTREDAYNMYVFDVEDGHTEIMPLWTPPTPPQDDNDIYIDSVMMLMYDTTPMPESKLPPVYIRKEHKRLKMDPSAAARKKKKGHGETVIPPRSLFEKASMLKVRREVKDQKKNFSLKQQAPFAKPLPSLAKPAMEAGQDNPEWLISEDWALLQAVKQLLELPLNLTIVSPAHTPNWDLVSDVVNSCSRIYRSPKQCRNRYENVIIPREEGKLVYEANPKKKTKSIYKNSRPLRTCQIYTQDDNATHIQLYNSRFELMKIIASKRSPPIKPLLGMNPFQKNPKHASVLAESGISYDKPLPPIQVASQRAERIAKEKKVLISSVPPLVFLFIQVLCHLIPFTLFLLATVGGNVIVNTIAGVPQSPFQPNKRLASSVMSGTLSPAGTAGAQVVHAQQRPVTAAGPAEVVAIATGQAVRAVTPVTASAVVSTTVSPVRSLVTQVTGNELIIGFLQVHILFYSPDLSSVLFHASTVHKQKLQQQATATQGQQATGAQQAAQVPAAQTVQANPQLAAVTTQRPGAVLATNLPMGRLSGIQAQAGQTAQVTLTKPPVVSMPAVVSSAGVMPVTVAGISVAISQPQKTGVLKFLNCIHNKMQQYLLLIISQQTVQVAAAPQQKAGQPQPGQATVTVQTAQQGQQPQQKLTYTTTQLQSGIKTQFFATSLPQGQKAAGAQQIQQLPKIPQIVQQQPTVANIQQLVSSPQIQAQPQTVTLTQAATSATAQVQMIPAGTATAQVVQQKIIQQQVVTTAASPQIQTPPPHSPAQQPAATTTAESPVQQSAQSQQASKGQARQGGIRAKTPAKPSGGSS
uniref:E1A binding protein p400 n=1 Tax=Oreochromis niloticus TaxID=8128 RepID=A0A669D1N1_ORENI